MSHLNFSKHEQTIWKTKSIKYIIIIWSISLFFLILELATLGILGASGFLGFMISPKFSLIVLCVIFILQIRDKGFSLGKGDLLLTLVGIITLALFELSYIGMINTPIATMSGMIYLFVTTILGIANIKVELFSYDVWFAIVCGNLLLTRQAMRFLANGRMNEDWFGDGFFYGVALVLVLARILYKSIFRPRIDQRLLLSQQMEEQKAEYLKKISDQEKETRKFRHDIKNHLWAMHQLLENEEYDKSKQYIADMISDMEEITGLLYEVGNDFINILLNHYLGNVSKDIQVDVKGKLIELGALKEKEICTVLSNVLENAIEATSKEEDSKICCEFEQGKTFIRFSISNTCIEKPTEDVEGKYISSKLDQNVHGIGLINVKRVIQKNKGQFEQYWKEGTFYTNILMWIDGEKL